MGSGVSAYLAVVSDDELRVAVQGVPKAERDKLTAALSQVGRGSGTSPENMKKSKSLSELLRANYTAQEMFSELSNEDSAHGTTTISRKQFAQLSPILQRDRLVSRNDCFGIDTDEGLSELFSELDLNKDEKLSLEEFYYFFWPDQAGSYDKIRQHADFPHADVEEFNTLTNGFASWRLIKIGLAKRGMPLRNVIPPKGIEVGKLGQLLNMVAGLEPEEIKSALHCLGVSDGETVSFDQCSRYLDPDDWTKRNAEQINTQLDAKITEYRMLVPETRRQLDAAREDAVRELDKAGPLQVQFPPPFWAMTLRQWHTYVMLCKADMQDQPGLATDATAEYYDPVAARKQRKAALHNFDTPWNPDKKFTRKIMTLYHVVTTFVKPLTAGTGSGLALLFNRAKPLHATLMISHAWGEDMDECAEALALQQLEGKLDDDTAAWFCGFSMYQPGNSEGDCGPTIQDQIAMDPFKSVVHSVAVKSGHGMVVVHTMTAELYGRLWCVFEAHEALEMGVAVAGVASRMYSTEFSKQGPFSLVVDTDKAICSCGSDQAMIRDMILGQSGGFGRLDVNIFGFRIRMLTSLLRQGLSEGSQVGQANEVPE